MVARVLPSDGTLEVVLYRPGEPPVRLSAETGERALIRGLQLLLRADALAPATRWWSSRPAPPAATGPAGGIPRLAPLLNPVRRPSGPPIPVTAATARLALSPPSAPGGHPLSPQNLSGVTGGQACEFVDDDVRRPEFGFALPKCGDERIVTGRLADHLRRFGHGSYAHWSGNRSTACRASIA